MGEKYGTGEQKNVEGVITLRVGYLLISRRGDFSEFRTLRMWGGIRIFEFLGEMEILI